jgi:hypothetical protein
MNIKQKSIFATNIKTHTSGQNGEEERAVKTAKLTPFIHLPNRTVPCHDTHLKDEVQPSIDSARL